jgi:hypothetical protein
MVLSEFVERAVGQAPVGVMAYAAVERALDPALVDAAFAEHAREQYTRELLLSELVDLMAAVVCRAQPSVRQAYAADPPGATLTAVYAKLAGIEPHVARQVVRQTADRLREVIDELRPGRDPWFRGYETRVLDGNVLKGSQHRLKVPRGTRASALAGLSVTVLDPDRGLAVDWFPSENGHDQERSLLPAVLDVVRPGEVWVGDRNFCTTAFVGGVIGRHGRFLIRQHESTVRVEELGELRPAGRAATGAVFEQRVRLTNVAGRPVVRRVVLRLDRPTEDGDTEIRLLTNLPVKAASAERVAERYRERWGIERLFWRLTVVRNAEVRPRAYPRAALFGFAVALLVSNAFAVVTEALQAAHPAEPVREELSHDQVGLELRQSRGLLAVVGGELGVAVAGLTAAAFAAWLRGLARRADWTRYRKTRRGPKKPRPDRPKCPRYRHVATKKLLDQCRAQAP